MLIDLLNKVIGRINALDIDAETQPMWDQIARSRPDILEQVEAAEEPLRSLMAASIAKGTLNLVKRVPEIIHRLVEPLEKRTHTARVRCSLAGALAYVAQPNDLVPDDAPGGYGFLDDYILARATLIEFLRDIEGLDRATPESLKMSATMLPPDVVPKMQRAVDGVTLTYQILGSLPDTVLELTTAQLIQNPLAAAGGQAAAWTGGPSLGSGGGFFGSSGIYVEGDDIVIPGGPSVVGGVLHVPE